MSGHGLPPLRRRQGSGHVTSSARRSQQMSSAAGGQLWDAAVTRKSMDRAGPHGNDRSKGLARQSQSHPASARGSVGFNSCGGLASMADPQEMLERIASGASQSTGFDPLHPQYLLSDTSGLGGGISGWGESDGDIRVFGEASRNSFNGSSGPDLARAESVPVIDGGGQAQAGAMVASASQPVLHSDATTPTPATHTPPDTAATTAATGPQVGDGPVDGQPEAVVDNGREGEGINSKPGHEDDNEALRLEIQRLKQALVGQFRGRDRCVSGSQFRPQRGSVSGGAANGGAQSDGQCQSCASLRAALRKSKAETRNVRTQLQLANEKHFADMRARASTANEQTLLDELENLRRQLANMEADRALARASPSTVGDASQLTEGELSVLRIKLTQKSAELTKAQDERDALHERMNTMRAEHEKVRSALGTQLADRDARIQSLETEVLELSRRQGQSSDETGRTMEQLAEYRQRLEEMKGISEQMEADLHAQLQSKNQMQAELDALRARAAQAGKLEEELRAVKVRANEQQLLAEQAQRDATQSRQLEQEHKDALEKAKRRVLELEKLLEDAQDANGVSDDAITKAEALAHRLREELANTKRELDETFTENKRLEAQVDHKELQLTGLHNELEELRVKLGGLTEFNRNVLERAMNSVVRLCVVAPTVNVHMSQTQHQTYQSSVSQEEVGKFLEAEVLSRLTKLFVQPGDAQAEDGTDLEEWLHRMLAELQRTIEAHLTSLLAKSEQKNPG